MKKIIFNGFYGYKNTGDDAFVEITSWGNRHFWKNTESAFYPGKDLPETLNPIKRIYPNNKSTRLIEKLFVLKEALSTDYFINAGGSVFSKITPLSDIVFAQNAEIINKKIKHGGIGVSIGPFNSVKDEKKVIEYLKRLEFLALRDTKSYDYAKSLDLDYNPIKAFDLAALLPECYNDFDSNSKEKAKEIKTIGISICNYERYKNGNIKNEEKRNKFVQEVIKRLSKYENIQLKFFIFNGHSTMGDEALTLETAALIPEEKVTILPYSKNIKFVWDEIKKCDYMFSTRLHASVFSCYAGVPFTLVEYHRKCGDFLEDIGYDDQKRVFDAEVSVNECVQNIISDINGSYKTPVKIQETIDRARLNFTEIKL